MRLLSSALLFCLSLTALADPPVTGPAEFPQNTVAVFKTSFKGVPDLNWPAALSVQTRGNESFVAGPPGTYTLSGEDFWINWEAKQFGRDKYNLTFTIKPVGPQPTPTPTPTPDPQPDDPTPDNPFELRAGDAGVKVLIVYESEDVAKLTAPQYLTIFGASFRDYLNTTCGFDGYRIFDKDEKPTGPAEWWVKAMGKKDRRSLPWLYAGKGKWGYSGPLTDAAAAKKAIDKIAAK